SEARAGVPDRRTSAARARETIGRIWVGFPPPRELKRRSLGNPLMRGNRRLGASPSAKAEPRRGRRFRADMLAADPAPCAPEARFGVPAARHEAVGAVIGGVAAMVAPDLGILLARL